MKIAARSPISLTDIEPGDYILAIDGKECNTMKEMREILDTHKPGKRSPSPTNTREEKPRRMSFLRLHRRIISKETI